MTVRPRHRRGRQSWKDSAKAKTIAGTISLLLCAGYMVMLVFAFLSML
jgi:folate-dependent phosphoribosylglycinamide formyltransferase PurN